MSFAAAGQNILTVGFGQTRSILMDWRPAFREMAEAYATYEEAVFATEGAAGLGRWQALSPAYGAWKAKNYPGRPILTREGTMRAAAGTVLFLGRDRLAMGPGSLVGPYPAVHEFGSRDGRIPRRPFVRPNARLLRDLREIARRHLVKARRAMKIAERIAV